MALAQKLLATLAADGSTPWYTVQGGEAQFGHNVVFGVNGSLGGGTLKAEIALDAPTVQTPVVPVTITGLESLVTGKAQIQPVIPPGSRIRFTLTGSTAPAAACYVLE